MTATLYDQALGAGIGEGWGVFETGGFSHAFYEIQQVDLAEDGEPQLDGDDTAWRILVSKAAAGSPQHVATLAFLAICSPEELVGLTHFFLYGRYRTFLAASPIT